MVIKALGLVSGLGGEGWTWVDLIKVCFRSPDSQFLFFAIEKNNQLIDVEATSHRMDQIIGVITERVMAVVEARVLS